MSPCSIIKISPEDALPYIYTYINRMGIDEDTATTYVDGIYQAIWCGFVIKDRCRAVLGLIPLSVTDVYVWAALGDGSGDIEELIAGAVMTKVIEGLPYHLSGSISSFNVASQHHAEKLGWQPPTDTDVLDQVWTREFKPGAA